MYICMYTCVYVYVYIMYICIICMYVVVSITFQSFWLLPYVVRKFHEARDQKLGCTTQFAPPTKMKCLHVQPTNCHVFTNHSNFRWFRGSRNCEQLVCGWETPGSSLAPHLIGNIHEYTYP